MTLASHTMHATRLASRLSWRVEPHVSAVSHQTYTLLGLLYYVGAVPIHCLCQIVASCVNFYHKLTALLIIVCSGIFHKLRLLFSRMFVNFEVFLSNLTDCT